jgi:hypothetical protein
MSSGTMCPTKSVLTRTERDQPMTVHRAGMTWHVHPYGSRRCELAPAGLPRPRAYHSPGLSDLPHQKRPRARLNLQNLIPSLARAA